MTTRDVAAALEALVRDVTTSASAGDVAERWGDVTESRLRPGGWRVECGAPSPIAVLEIRPWDADGHGLVDLALREGVAVSWPELRQRFGPWVQAPRRPGRPAEHVARQAAPTGAVADATLLVEVEDDDVVGIAIRRDGRRS